MLADAYFDLAAICDCRAHNDERQCCRLPARQSVTCGFKVPVADWRQLLCGTTLPGDDDRVSDQLNTISSEAAAPTAPATATASQGSACEAMTPAKIMAAPWPSCIPAIASPNAWPRRSSGTAATKAAFAPT